MQYGLVAQVGARIAAIGQGVMAVMGERQVAGAQGAELLQHADVLADGMAVLHRTGMIATPGSLRPGGSSATVVVARVARSPLRSAPMSRIAASMPKPVPAPGPTLRRARPLAHIGGETAGPQPAPGTILPISTRRFVSVNGSGPSGQECRYGCRGSASCACSASCVGRVGCIRAGRDQRCIRRLTPESGQTSLEAFGTRRSCAAHRRRIRLGILG